MMPICTISARFFSPPEKPTFTGRLSISVHPEQRRLLARELEELAARQLGLAARAALGVEAVRRNWTLETPGISTGYWKPRNSPARARALSGGFHAASKDPSQLGSNW